MKRLKQCIVCKDYLKGKQFLSYGKSIYCTLCFKQKKKKEKMEKKNEVEYKSTSQATSSSSESSSRRLGSANDGSRIPATYKAVTSQFPLETLLQKVTKTLNEAYIKSQGVVSSLLRGNRAFTCYIWIWYWRFSKWFRY